MRLIDVREQSGPYWAAYQDYRRRENVLDNPDFVPAWFVAKVARERVAAARVSLEGLLPPEGNIEFHNRRVLWQALKVVEEFIQTTNTLDLAAEQLVAALLGTQEIETERERRDFNVHDCSTIVPLRPNSKLSALRQDGESGGCVEPGCGRVFEWRALDTPAGWRFLHLSKTLLDIPIRADEVLS